jgi:hypothetical protein
LDPLPLIGAGIAFALAPICLALIGILFWKRLHSDYEMTVPRWIGFGLGIVIITGVLGYSLLVQLGFLEDS